VKLVAISICGTETDGACCPHATDSIETDVYIQLFFILHILYLLNYYNYKKLTVVQLHKANVWETISKCSENTNLHVSCTHKYLCSYHMPKVENFLIKISHNILCDMHMPVYTVIVHFFANNLWPSPSVKFSALKFNDIYNNTESE